MSIFDILKAEDNQDPKANSKDKISSNTSKKNKKNGIGDDADN